MNRSRLLVFASGTKDGGGSGFVKLTEAIRDGVLQADIAAVVSNHERGGVWEKARSLGISFIHFAKPWNAGRYQEIFQMAQASHIALSGWLKMVSGLDPRVTVNIHPGILMDGPGEFGGHGMYGHHVHEAAIKAFQEGRITHSGLSMHFVTEQVDGGPVFFRCHVPITKEDTPDSLAQKVNAQEHRWQSVITNLVVTDQISWDGENPKSLRLPDDYEIDAWV